MYGWYGDGRMYLNGKYTSHQVDWQFAFKSKNIIIDLKLDCDKRILSCIGINPHKAIGVSDKTKGLSKKITQNQGWVPVFFMFNENTTVSIYAIDKSMFGIYI